MAIALDIRLWFDPPCDVAESFDALLACVAGWPPAAALPWSQRSSEGPKLSATNGQLTVDRWGAAWIESGRACGPRALVGDAAVWLHQVAPYVAGPEASPERVAQVEQHVDALTDLVTSLVETLEPTSLKLFTDAAPYVPVDAHAAYFRDSTVALADVQLVAAAWTGAIPGFHPLVRTDPERAFHEWRGRSGSAALHARLSRALEHVDDVTADMVAAALRSCPLTAQRCGTGTLVLDYPNVLGAFLDEFYLDILERAAQ